MKMKLESYSKCIAYDLLLQIKPLFAFDEKASSAVSDLINYLGDNLQVYSGEPINADNVAITFDENLDIEDVQVLLPLLKN